MNQLHLTVNTVPPAMTWNTNHSFNPTVTLTIMWSMLPSKSNGFFHGLCENQQRSFCLILLTDRQTDTQTDTQTDRHTDRHTHTQTDTHTDRHTDRRTDRQSKWKHNFLNGDTLSTGCKLKQCGNRIEGSFFCSSLLYLTLTDLLQLAYFCQQYHKNRSGQRFDPRHISD